MVLLSTKANSHKNEALALDNVLHVVYPDEASFDSSFDGSFDISDNHSVVPDDRESSINQKASKWDSQWCKPSYVPITVIFILILLVIIIPQLQQGGKYFLYSQLECTPEHVKSCRISLVESLPVGLTYDAGSTPHSSTFQTWLNLIENANTSIKIASFYWSLRKDEIYPDPSSVQGEAIFEALLRAGTERNVKISIAQNQPSEKEPNTDTELLAERGAAEVRNLNFTHLLGGGVLHTKLWIFDDKHVYIGSANMDWRSLTQVKELGVAVYDCSCFATDAVKLFDVYWYLGQKNARIPSYWPSNFSTRFNMVSPMKLQLNGTGSNVYLGSSPPLFCPFGRTEDLSSIEDVILTAKKFIYISVMDYLPLTIYTKPIKFWPVIDDALRKAAIENRVMVRLLISHWEHSKHSMDHFLKSLMDISDSYPWVTVQVKFFVVPTNETLEKIPFARVNHNKYMITDNAAYIGTSNWSGDYFIDTAGVGVVIREAVSNGTKISVQDQLYAIFVRDWNSKYTHSLHGNNLLVTV